MVENFVKIVQHKVSYPSFFLLLINSFGSRSLETPYRFPLVPFLSLFFFLRQIVKGWPKRKRRRKKRIPSIDIRHTFFRASFLRGWRRERAIPAAFSSIEIYDRRVIDNGSVRPRVRTSQAANTRRDPNSFRLKKEEKRKEINFPGFQVFQVS